MRAALVERDGHRATVRLTPSWFARLSARRRLDHLRIPARAVDRADDRLDAARAGLATTQVEQKLPGMCILLAP